MASRDILATDLWATLSLVAPRPTSRTFGDLRKWINDAKRSGLITLDELDLLEEYLNWLIPNR